MSFSYYIKMAFKNITNSKKQSILFTIGITVTISLILSLQLWSATAENVALEDFLENQDFELKVTSFRYQELPGILNWLEQKKPLIELTTKIHYNIALFNAEDKPLDYRFMPEEDQEDISNPVSVTALALLEKDILKRIAYQFIVRGEFNLEKNEVLISEYEAQELERIYGSSIEPGMKINVSIARRPPERGEVFLYHCDLKHFYNVTVKGIYRTIPITSMFQKTFSASFLKDSIIFLNENMEEEDISLMESYGLEPIYMSKCNIAELKKDGIDEVLGKLIDVVNQLKINFPSSQTIILDSPIIELQQTYSYAKIGIIFALPLIITSIIISVFIINMTLEMRRNQITTLRDRGAEKIQIVGFLLTEFLFLTIIAILLGLGLSFLIAGLIPAFSSGIFSWNSYFSFLTKTIFSFSLFFFSSLAIILIVSIFTILKTISTFENNLEEKERMALNKVKKWTLWGISLLSICVLTILLIVFGYYSFTETKDIYNFSLEQTQDNLVVFLFINLLILFFSVIASLLLPILLSKLKKLYTIFKPKNSFFIYNAIKRSNTKLSILLLILVIIVSTNVFSLNLYITNDKNIRNEGYYINGADIRIQTSYTNYDFALNLSQIVGIEEAIPVIFAEGRLIYNSVTVVGVDPLKYHKIGRWELNSEPKEEIFEIFKRLNQTEDGAIVSEVIAKRLNLSVGRVITVSGLPNGSYVDFFTVVGILRSAPGFGLTYGINLELLQSNQEILFINERLMRNKFAISDTNLFFASLSEGYSLEDVQEEIFEFSDVLSINPQKVNQFFVGVYIERYIPKVNDFLLFQVLLINFFGISFIFLNIDFLLKEREKNNAILNSIGNSIRDLRNQIISELILVLFSAIVVGLLIGIPFSILAVMLNRPIFSSNNILPLNYTFDFLRIPLFIILLITVSVLAIIPSQIRFRKQIIARTLQT